MAIEPQTYESFPITQTFDYFSRLEKPIITLCNPDKTPLYILNSCYDTEIKLRWNAQSEFSFTFPKTVDGTDLDSYDYILGKRLILVENIGYFIITNVEDDFDGSVPIKTVTCLSQESELVYKKVILLSGTYSLSELMDEILALAPNWSLQFMDSDLSSLYRTFNVSDTNVYNFLMTDVSMSYNCVFIFDYEDKNINIISADREPDETDIFLSFENLLKNTSYQEVTTEITTVLYPYGGNNLTVRNVNPLGTNALYDFTYYKDTDWMSGSLISAIEAWEDKIDLYREDYSQLVVLLASNSGSLLVYQAELAELEAVLASDQQVRAVRVQQGLDTTEIDAQIVLDELAIANQEILIEAIERNISLYTDELEYINDLLSLTNTDNFTEAQYNELSNFIFENTYRNDNIITTDSMTPEEIQEQAQALYDSALEVLAKAAIPRYQITINSANFLALQEYSHFTDQLSLGDQITVDTGRGYFIDATLLEYTFSYDNIDNFNIMISNRNRIDDAHFIFSDLFGQSVQSAVTLGFNSANWNDWITNKPTIINQVITPDGVLEYGIVADNIKGTIDAKDDLAIKNTNITTGSTNFYADQYGVVLRDATLYSGSNIGSDGEITTAGGGVLFFRSGIYIGGTGLTGSGVLYTLENCTGQTGSHITVSETFLAGSTKVYVNGLTQLVGYNYSENGDVQSVTMWDSILSGDVIMIEYIPLS